MKNAPSAALFVRLSELFCSMFHTHILTSSFGIPPNAIQQALHYSYQSLHKNRERIVLIWYMLNRLIVVLSYTSLLDGYSLTRPKKLVTKLTRQDTKSRTSPLLSACWMYSVLIGKFVFINLFYE